MRARGRYEQYFLQAAAAVALLAAVLAVRLAAVPAWEEYIRLREENRLQRDRLQQLQELSLAGNDYAARLAERQKQLLLLRSRLPACADANDARRLAERLALQNGLRLAMLRTADAGQEAQSGAPGQLRVYGLQLEAAGDYYAVLRFLRQLERQHAAVVKLELQGEGADGAVRAAALLRVYGVKSE